MDLAKPPWRPKAPAVYDKAFFARVDQAALPSAEIVVPILMQIVHPGSVVDVGCGTGLWLSLFKRAGVRQVLGLDGDWVESASLHIAQDEFLCVDLGKSFSVPETFDLALCLEVAEHLPRRRARELINSLARLSPIVLFSAAVPGQGGTKHLNEQWPAYWEGLFLETGYLALDAIRPLIWQDPRVAWYYRQNCFLFARRDLVESDDSLRALASTYAQNDMLLIHKSVLAANLALTLSLKRIPGLFVSAVLRYLGR